MTDTKLSDETAAGTLDGTEEVRISQMIGGSWQTRRTTLSLVAALAAGGAGSLPWVTVEGRTDTQINAAVAAINALPNGGVLYFPAGAPYVSAGGHVFTVPVTIIGDGTADCLTQYALSWIQCTSATADMFTFNVNQSEVYDVFIQNTATGTPTAGAGLHFLHGDGSRCRDVVVSGFWNNWQYDNAGEWFNDCCFSYAFVNYGMWIRNVASPDGGDQFLSNFSSISKTHNGISHVRYESGGGLKINNIKINSRGGTNAVTGIDVAIPDGVSTVDFQVNLASIENLSGIPIKISNAGSGQMPCIMLRGVQASEYGSNAAIDIEATATGRFDRVIIDDVIATGGSGAVINLSNIDNVAIGQVVYLNHTEVVSCNNVTNLRNQNARLGTVTLPYASTIAWDLANADNYRVVLTGNATLANPTTPSSGQTVQIRVIQDGTGSRTLAYGSKFKFPGGTAPVLSTAANAKDLLTFQYDGNDDTYWLVSAKAFA